VKIQGIEFGEPYTEKEWQEIQKEKEVIKDKTRGE
jgi:hypothetical protein